MQLLAVELAEALCYTVPPFIITLLSDTRPVFLPKYKRPFSNPYHTASGFIVLKILSSAFSHNTGMKKVLNWVAGALSSVRIPVFFYACSLFCYWRSQILERFRKIYWLSVSCDFAPHLVTGYEHTQLSVNLLLDHVKHTVLWWRTRRLSVHYTWYDRTETRFAKLT